jgi:hypothetical protein
MLKLVTFTFLFGSEIWLHRMKLISYLPVLGYKNANVTFNHICSEYHP